MKRRLIYHNAPRHALKRMDAATRGRVLAALEILADSEQGDLLQLHGMTPPTYRLRVGKWRAVFRLPDPRTIEVTNIDNRGEAYRQTR